MHFFPCPVCSFTKYRDHLISPSGTYKAIWTQDNIYLGISKLGFWLSACTSMMKGQPIVQ